MRAAAEAVCDGVGAGYYNYYVYPSTLPVVPMPAPALKDTLSSFDPLQANQSLPPSRRTATARLRDNFPNQQQLNPTILLPLPFSH